MRPHGRQLSAVVMPRSSGGWWISRSGPKTGLISRGLDAAVFVGGKVSTAIGDEPGILHDHELFRTACSGKPAFVLGMARGAAAWLTAEPIVPGDPRDPRLRKVSAETTDPALPTALIVAGLLDE